VYVYMSLFFHMSAGTYFFVCLHEVTFFVCLHELTFLYVYMNLLFCMST
jgi:hypothetical protein